MNHPENTIPCNAAFKQEVLLACYKALTAMGFTRYRKNEVDWPLENGFHCWVGLNTGLFSEFVQINPFVGVHTAPIMKLYTTLEGRKYNRSIATYAVHIGLLSPNEKLFQFTRETHIEEEAERLAQLYVEVGLPYAKSIASYEKLLPLLQERIDMLGAYPERVATCLYLMGRVEEAREFTESFLAKKPDYFADFALPFLKKIAH